MASATDHRIGQLLDDKYRIVRLLGEGGMGSVYEARHELIGRRFAIKLLHPELALHADILMRFRREAQAAGALENENIAAVTDFGETDDGAPYIVMEFLLGEDLSRLLARAGALPVLRAAQLLLQACRGLSAAHAQGIVHRDLKPENLFVLQHGDGSDLIKLLDFGIAKLKHAGEGASSTRTGATMGTPYYMPREQARGQKDLDQRADIYALGVILYELLSGQKPFQGEGYNEILFRILSGTAPPLAVFRPDLPPELVALVEQAMAPEPGDRFQSVGELARALEPFAVARESQPARSAAVTNVAVAAPNRELSTVPGTSATVPAASLPRRRSGWLVVALLLTTLGTGVAWATLRTRSSALTAVPPTTPVAMAQPKPAPSIAAPLLGPEPTPSSAAAAPIPTQVTSTTVQHSKTPRPTPSHVGKHAVDPYAP